MKTRFTLAVILGIYIGVIVGMRFAPVRAQVALVESTEGGNTVAVILSPETAAALLNALVVATGAVPPATPCQPDPDADVRGVKPANPRCVGR